MRSMDRMTLITGEERRRRWHDDDRRRILAAIFEPGAIIAEVARREDISTSLIYRWRREERLARGCGFAPVVIEASPAVLAPKAVETAAIEVAVKAAQVRIFSHAPSALIAATLKALQS